MTSTENSEFRALERENRSLRRKLEKSGQKMEMLEVLQQQNANLMRVVMEELDEERAESDRLLLNILPAPIAEQLKAQRGVIAEKFESASVLFSDIVGFTALSDTMPAEDLVEWLNAVYSEIDRLVQVHDVEKIRTIGDGYMVAAGVPSPRADHAAALTELAFDMRSHFVSLPPIGGKQVNFRIGISSGPLVAGVIGTHKFQYDIWGDTVNTAARMESLGVPGRIHISDATHELIKDNFDCELRGQIEVKGKGLMTTWFV
jgi:class 3 adenylate cyclase